MKRIIALVLIVILALALCACGARQQPDVVENAENGAVQDTPGEPEKENGL